MVKMDIIKVYKWKNLYQTEQQISWKMKIKEIGQNLDKKEQMDIMKKIKWQEN